MGGVIDWAAIPILVEVYGVVDVEMFIKELMAIRKHGQHVNEVLRAK